MTEDPLERIEREEREKKNRNGSLKTATIILAVAALALGGALAWIWSQKSSLVNELEGEKAELTIDTNGGKVNSVVVTNDLDADYSMKQAAQRCKNLMDKLAEQYNAEWETVCEGYYELKLPYGKASCSYASGCAAGYEVVLNIVDSVETE